jgi:alpha-D-ribose 1-methylphosphonate 5-triphosphate synthase subunit PhnG
MTKHETDHLSRIERQAWMAVLSRAARAELEAFTAGIDLPDYELVKGPETGAVMIEARAGGTGRRFNCGEATVTRAVVRMAGDVMGCSYALGRDTRKAELAAVLDGMLQSETWAGRISRELIVPLRERQEQQRIDVSRKAAATKVEFFTLQRGDG